MMDSPSLISCLRIRRCTMPSNSGPVATPSPHCRRSRTRRRTPQRSPVQSNHCHDDIVLEHHDHLALYHHHPCIASWRTWLETAVYLDHTISAWVHTQGLGLVFYVFLRLLEFSGDGMFLIPCAAATFLAPKQRLTPEVRMFFFNLFITFIFDLIFVSILKKMVRRPRPSYNHGHFLALQVDHWSFPSGHSTRALITTTLFRLYLSMWRDQACHVWMPFVTMKLQKHVVILPKSMPLVESMMVNAIVGVIAIWALATTTSRVILGRHFLCDVLVGALIGVGEAIFAHKYLFIPLRMCEHVHGVINYEIAWIENSVYNWTSSRNFVVNQVKKK